MSYLRNRIALKIIIVMFMTIIYSAHAMAWSVVGNTKINFVENGWNGEGLALHVDYGLSGCPAPDTEFAISANHPAYKELVSIVLAAFTTQAKVQIVADPEVCLFGD